MSITQMVRHRVGYLVIKDSLSGITFAGDLVWDGISSDFMSSSLLIGAIRLIRFMPRVKV